MRRIRRTASEINLTPLVDVMLTVLALFMITAPMALQGPEVDLPGTPRPDAATEDTKKLVITVQRDGRIFYGDREITNDVERELASDPALVRERRVYVKGDREASFGAVSRVLSAASNAGVAGMNIVVDPEPMQRSGE